jgi:hypothetical protein
VLDARIERTAHHDDATTRSTMSEMSEIVCVADPSAYRACDAFVRDETGKTGRLEVVTVAVTEGGVSVGAFESGGADAATGTTRPKAKPEPENAEPSETLARATRALHLSDAGEPSSFEASTDEPARRLPSSTARVLRDAAPRSERGVAAEAGAGVEVLYARGKIADLPEAYASRRERFAPLDAVQAGWTVELRRRNGSSAVDAVFFDPDGVGYKAFADARREALRAKGKR